MLSHALRAVAIFALASSLANVGCLQPANQRLDDDTESSEEESDQTSNKKKKPKSKASADTEPTPPTPKTPTTPTNPSNPTAPSLSLVSPTSGTQGAASIQVSLAGSNFGANAVVKFAGVAVPSQAQGATSIVATVPQANLAQVGSFPIVVSNNGIDSNAITFTVVAVNTPVRLTSLTPPRVSEDSQATPLTVNGSGFAQGATVAFNGQDLTTNFVSETQLTATIPAASLTQPGTFPVTVRSGTQLSTPLSFTVDPRSTPTLTSIDTTTVLQNRVALSFVVRGSGFDTSTRVAVYSPAVPAGQAITPTATTSTTANATIPANHFAQAGDIAVRVYNLLPNNTGAYATNSATMKVQASGAGTGLSVTTVNPSAWLANSSGTVTVTGSGFTAGSLVVFDGFVCTATSQICRTNTATTATTITFLYMANSAPSDNIAVRVLNGTTGSNSVFIKLQ